ncbi:hypothetical protein DSM25559_5225 [Agrobacterium rosae]|uniref:Uncharacterized protein n=1 Tax=Agrobacterium rosae TaxID=1972867 RepID=A0A1R3U2V4_9HYPH|nr:hypothetical protein DSM25559_5225 [Agrobacterium rosae]
MLFWISMAVTALVVVSATAVLGFCPAEADMLHLGAYLVLLAVVGILISLGVLLWLRRR